MNFRLSHPFKARHTTLDPSVATEPPSTASNLLSGSQDLIGGLGLFLLGLFVVFYAQGYSSGTLARIGPGFFPLALGVVLLLLGATLALLALRRPQVLPQLEARNLLVVSLSLLVFALLLKTLGLALATFTTVLIASLADRQGNVWQALLLGVTTTLVTLLVFVAGLNLLVPVWPWQ